MKRRLSTLLLCLVLTVGCAKQVHAPIPGSVNQFDSDSYTSLVTAKAIIDAAKTELSNGTFAPSIAANVKEAINYAVASYNVADVSYVAYHSAAVAGTATPTQQAEVQIKLDTLSVAVNKVTAAKVAK